MDRDGCISPDQFGYLDDPGLYRLYPYTGEALRLLKKMGFLLFLVTNQSGIARGYFDIPTLERVLIAWTTACRTEGSPRWHLLFPIFRRWRGGPYNIEHEDRKPGIGMFKHARRQHVFEAGLSWMIGDRRTDVEFGHNSGMKTILLLSGEGAREMLDGLDGWPVRPDYVAENLLTAAKLIQMLEQ